MAYRLFQNSNKTQPITEAGVSVGYSERKQGTVDALQATTLSKPLLGRWPKSGIRNLAMGAQAVSVSQYWPNNAVSNGVTITKLGTGVDPEDGVPFADIHYVGTPTASSISGAFIHNLSRLDVNLNESFNSRVMGLMLGGSLSGVRGFRTSVALEDANGAYISETAQQVQLEMGVWKTSAPSTTVVNELARKVRTSLTLSTDVGQEIDVSVRYKGLQFERGLIQTPLQFNYTPNNITEPGGEDEWFLYNDGNDSLNTQPLQSGDFSVTSVDIYGNMDNKPSSGGSINSLVKERQRDVIVRSPPLIPSELEQVQAYWKAKGYKTEWSPLLLMSTQTDGHWSRGYNPNID